MSRIGNKIISVPAGVKVEQKGQNVKVSGALGSLEIICHPHIDVKFDGAAGGDVLVVLYETSKLFIVKFMPPADDVISKPNWTLSISRSLTQPLFLSHCKTARISTVPEFVLVVLRNEYTFIDPPPL